MLIGLLLLLGGFMTIGRYNKITVVFRQKNGMEWEEHYSSRMIEVFKKDPSVYQIKYTDTGKIIYTRS